MPKSPRRKKNKNSSLNLLRPEFELQVKASLIQVDAIANKVEVMCTVLACEN